MTRISLNNQVEPQGITVTQQDNVQSISVKQVDSTQEIPVSPDVKFLRGFSPTIEVEEVTGGFNVTITDVEHTEAIFIASGGEVSEDQIKEAVNAYLAENPVQSGATAEQAAQIEQNKADILALAEAIGNIEIPEVDLSDYAKKSEVPSVEGLASEAYVKDYAQPKGDYLTEEADPTVPAWAKQPNPPSYTADEVGADSKGSADSALAQAKAYADQQIAAIPTPDVSGQIGQHNVATDTHNDIRLLVEDLAARLTALADSDDDTLDQLSEVVAYIKANRELIESVTTAKVNVSDIIDNLTTNVSDRPLSAAQGVVLKGLVDAITVPTNVSAFTNDAGYLKELPEHEHPQYLTEHQSLADYAKKSEVPGVFIVTSTPAASVGKDGDIALLIGG